MSTKRDYVLGSGNVFADLRVPHPEEALAEPASVTEAMRHKLRSAAGHAIYKRRKAIVEPVFGQTKERRGFRRFSRTSTSTKCSCAAAR